MLIIRSLVVAVTLALGATAAQASCTYPQNANAFASDIANGLNSERARNGLPPLRYNATLSRSAVTHACDMQRNRFFSHSGSNGSNAFERAKRTGIRPCRVAENISFGFPTGQIVVQGWMDSPGHRRNMLQSDVREFGIGLADAPGGPYAVLVFLRSC